VKVRVEKTSGMNFAAYAGGRRVMISASPEVGGGGITDGGVTDGDQAGARPMEMVLMGLGGCSGIDVALILAKSRQNLAGMAIEITAERAPAPPAVFTRIHLHYILRGAGLRRKKVARALTLSLDKYCSVTRMLASTAEITHDFEIIEEPVEEPIDPPMDERAKA